MLDRIRTSSILNLLVSCLTAFRIQRSLLRFLKLTRLLTGFGLRLQIELSKRDLRDRSSLIVGRISDNTATVWIRANAQHPRVVLRVKPAHKTEKNLCADTIDIALNVNGTAEFISAVSAIGLAPHTRYALELHGDVGNENLTWLSRLREFFSSAREPNSKPLATASFRTSPPPGDAFSFLLGSCNLPVQRLNNVVNDLAALVPLSELGVGATANNSQSAPDSTWRFPSPFRRLNYLVRPRPQELESPPLQYDFCIHAGDQIYFDMSFLNGVDAYDGNSLAVGQVPRPNEKNYRDIYRRAWIDDEDAREFLARSAHYMTLDDHEIVDQFSNDRPPDEYGYCADDYKQPALAAYREYVHIRHGARDDDALHYEFTHAGCAFFVMDTRTERYALGTTGRPVRMISEEQLDRLKMWLHRWRDVPKFVVSSVPFVAELSRPSISRIAREQFERTSPLPVGREDKWCGDRFSAQREEIIQYLYSERIGRLVFLCGDMHGCYHASMDIGRGENPIKVHELMAGPFYQLNLARYQDFDGFRRRQTANDTTQVEYVSRLDRAEFYAGSPAVMHVRLECEADVEKDPTKARTLHWQLIRTLAGVADANPLDSSGRIDPDLPYGKIVI